MLLRLVFSSDGVGVVRALTRVKIENRSRKRSHKLYVIGVGRVRTCPLYPDSAFDSVTYDLAKTRLSESQAEAEEQTNHNPWN